MLQAQAIISKITTLADTTIRLAVDCQEMSPDNEAEIFKLRNQIGWFVFSPSMLQETDIPIDPVEDNQKTPSQRLRVALYVYHSKIGGKPEDFNEFYRKWVERKITQVKEKIQEVE